MLAAANMAQPVLSAEPILSIDSSRFSQLMHCRLLIRNGIPRTPAALVLGLVLIASLARAWDDRAQREEAIFRPTLLVPAVDTTDYQVEANSATQPANPAPTAGGLDPGLVATGQAAFSRSCTTCHDEQRSLQKSKSFGGWLATVQRMASKEGADISTADVQP